MKNSIIFVYILLTTLICVGCEGDKNNVHRQIFEYVNYHEIGEKDFSFWDGLVDDSDLTYYGPLGNVCKENDILTAESAAMIGEALIRSALNGNYVEESPKIVLNKSKYWIVQGITNSIQDNICFVFIAVIQKNNGKVLDFKILEQ